jgi:hypothetical protein
VFWHNIWKDAGQPASGAQNNLKCSSNLKYKLAIREAFPAFEDKHTDELHEQFLNKRIPEVLKSWNKKFHKLGTVTFRR